jgi:uncharacterized membrane protein YfcA
MIWAWLGATLVGLSLGLLGSGGAILTVPILVYLVGHDEKAAIVESLAIVGAIALFGAARASFAKKIDWKSALLLAIPGVFGTLLGTHVAQWIPGAVQLLLLAALMFTASVLMFRSPRKSEPMPNDVDTSVTDFSVTDFSVTDFSVTDFSVTDLSANDQAPTSGSAIIAAQGFALGFMTGIVGIGGGFLIVPVLVLLRRLPMKIAIGTSLAIIAVNCTAGLVKSIFAGSAALHPSATEQNAIDWTVIGLFIALGIVGSLIGSLLARRIDQGTLRKVFAVFLVVMAGYVAWRQAPRVFPQWFDAHSSTPTANP